MGNGGGSFHSIHEYLQEMASEFNARFGVGAWDATAVLDHIQEEMAAHYVDMDETDEECE